MAKNRTVNTLYRSLLVVVFICSFVEVVFAEYSDLYYNIYIFSLLIFEAILCRCLANIFWVVNIVLNTMPSVEKLS